MWGEFYFIFWIKQKLTIIDTIKVLRRRQTMTVAADVIVTWRMYIIALFTKQYNDEHKIKWIHFHRMSERLSRPSTYKK